MIVYTEKTVMKEEKPDTIFKTAEELKDYLNKCKIYDVCLEVGECQCGIKSGGLFEFQWGGSTLYFGKGDFYFRVYAAQIKQMRGYRKSNSVFIETKKGGLVHITCEPK